MKKALIVIDVQKYFLNKETKPVISKIKQYLKDKTKDYTDIYFTIFKNGSDSPLWQISNWRDCSNSPDTDICDDLKEFTNKNNVFYKNIFSAIKIQYIFQEIKENNISEVHLCGFDTDCCVLATAYDLFDQKIKPVILENLTWSTSKEKLHMPAIQMIERNIGFVKKVK